MQITHWFTSVSRSFVNVPSPLLALRVPHLLFRGITHGQYITKRSEIVKAPVSDDLLIRKCIRLQCAELPDLVAGHF